MIQTQNITLKSVLNTIKTKTLPYKLFRQGVMNMNKKKYYTKFNIKRSLVLTCINCNAGIWPRVQIFI